MILDPIVRICMHISTPGGTTLYEFYKHDDGPAYITTVMDNHFLTINDKNYDVTFEREVVEVAIQALKTDDLDDITSYLVTTTMHKLWLLTIE